MGSVSFSQYFNTSKLIPMTADVKKTDAKKVRNVTDEKNGERKLRSLQEQMDMNDLFQKKIRQIRINSIPLKFANYLMGWLAKFPISAGQGEIVSSYKKTTGLIKKTFNLPKFVSKDLVFIEEGKQLLRKITSGCHPKELLAAISRLAEAAFSVMRSTLATISSLHKTMLIDLKQISSQLPEILEKGICLFGIVKYLKRVILDLKRLCSLQDAPMRNIRKTLLRIAYGLLKLTAVILAALSLFLNIYVASTVIVTLSTVIFASKLNKNIKKWIGKVEAKPPTLKERMASVKV